jgi:hypothetical protein
MLPINALRCEMSYDYKAEMTAMLSSGASSTVLKRYGELRDKVQKALKTSGAFRLQELGIGDWSDFALIDYMVEIGELVEFKRECWGQYRVFTTPYLYNQ